ncbi:quinol dehydrogenase ferredoxin subunit NapH [Endothiovibrio diazotrophicus]
MVPFALVGRDAVAEKGWWAAHRWLLLRRLSQLAVIALFLLGPWAGIWLIKGNLSSSLLLERVPMTDPLLFAQLLAGGFLTPLSTAITGVALVTGFYALVGGRVYCAWVCPVNLLTDGAHWLRERSGVRGGARLSRNTRYWMLAMVLAVAAATGSLAYEMLNPVSMFHRTLIFGAGALWGGAGLLLAGLFLFDLLVAKRGWCSHLCPMGAAYRLIGTLSPLRVRADRRERCNDCMECFAVCPEPRVIKPALKGAARGIGPVILSADCTNCGRCIDICSKGVFGFGLRFPNAVNEKSDSTTTEVAR